MKDSKKLRKNNFKKYLLIDICGTYVHENTTFGLIKKHFSKYSFKGIYIRLFTYKFSPLKIFIIILEKIIGNDILKKILILSLRGVKISSLEKTAHEYAKDLLSKKSNVNSEISACIKKYSDNFQPIFASSSIEPIVKEISSLEKIPYISSKLEVINDKYTGKIYNDVTGLKSKEIYKKFNIDLHKNNYYLITDNKSDLNMVNDSVLTFFICRKKKISFNVKDFKIKKIKILYLKN